MKKSSCIQEESIETFANDAYFSLSFLRDKIIDSLNIGEYAVTKEDLICIEKAIGVIVLILNGHITRGQKNVNE